MATRPSLRRQRATGLPRAVIQHDVPRTARLTRLFLLAGLVAGLMALAFWLGVRWAPDVAVLQQRIAPAETLPPQTAREPEPDSSSDAGGAQSQLTMLRSAQEQLLAQVKSLESENTRLKEDLALFERFLPGQAGTTQGIAVQGFTAELVKPNAIRYRLLVMRNGQSSREFDGNLEIAVSLLQTGKTVTMTFPEKGSGDIKEFDLSFRYYQRIEGTITIPQDATVKTVQARVMEKGKLRAQESVDL